MPLPCFTKNLKKTLSKYSPPEEMGGTQFELVSLSAPGMSDSSCSCRYKDRLADRSLGDTTGVRVVSWVKACGSYSVRSLSPSSSSESQLETDSMKLSRAFTTCPSTTSSERSPCCLWKRAHSWLYIIQDLRNLLCFKK